MKWMNWNRFMGGMSGSPPPPPPPPSASFLGTDTTTLGAWNGVYGTDGYVLTEPDINGTASLPAGWTWAAAGESFFTWPSFAFPTAEPQLPGSVSTFLSTYFSTTNFTVSVEVAADAGSYHLEIYCADGDNKGRQQNITIKDGSGNVLDGPRLLTAFAHGVYLKYAITGSIQIVFANVSGHPNAVTQAILIDP